MRIAQIAPLYEAVPPRLYGGTERIVAHLTDAWSSSATRSRCSPAPRRGPRRRWWPCRDQAIRLDPAPLKSDLAAHLAMLHEVHRRRRRVRRHPLPPRHDPFPVLRERRGADRHHAARPARPQGPAGRLRALAASSRWSRSPTTSAGRCPMPTGSPPSSTGWRPSSYRFTAAPKRPLSRLPRPDLAGEAPGPGDRDRQALRHAR